QAFFSRQRAGRWLFLNRRSQVRILSRVFKSKPLPTQNLCGFRPRAAERPDPRTAVGTYLLYLGSGAPMPKLGAQNPKYRKHRASGQARVTIAGKDIYLGPYGTAASRREYD